MMFDRFLAMYWTPKGTPLWKLHLPVVLIGTILLSLLVVIGVSKVTNLFSVFCFLFSVFCVLVVTQFILGYLSRRRFGDKCR